MKSLRTIERIPHGVQRWRDSHGDYLVISYEKTMEVVSLSEVDVKRILSHPGYHEREYFFPSRIGWR